MTAARMIGAILAGLAAGCAHVAKAPWEPPVRTAEVSTTESAPAAPPIASAAAPPAPVEPSREARSPTTPAKNERPAMALAKPASPPAARASEAKPAPPAVSNAGVPPLDLKSLEERLKESRAIGVMTKLSLKNQVDDLLDQFRDYYQGRLKTTLAELRRRYELLLMKVLTLLQDGDPSLAKAIHASREAIWAILADREKLSRTARGEAP